MLKSFLFYLLPCATLLANTHEEWAKSVSLRVDQEAVEWLREVMKKEIPKNSHSQDLIQEKKCRGSLFSPQEPSVYVFTSFSVPEMIWLEQGSELNRIGGVFVLRGIPKNSFSEFSKRTLELKKSRMEASIRIDPSLFERFQVDKVPTIVVTDGESFDKISGAVSVRFALEKMKEEGTVAYSDKLVLRG